MSGDFDLDAARASQAAARARAAQDLDVTENTTSHLTPQAITACGLCDDDGYRGNHVCDHQDHAGAAKRGIAKVRAAMTKGGKR